MNVKETLAIEIESQIKAMEDMEIGSEVYRDAIDGLNVLLSKFNDLERTEFEYQDKYEAREKETEVKLMQVKEDRKDRIVKNCLTAVSVVGGIAVTVWGTIKTLKFEEEGTITTNAGRAFVNKLFPKK